MEKAQPEEQTEAEFAAKLAEIKEIISKGFLEHLKKGELIVITKDYFLKVYNNVFKQANIKKNCPSLYDYYKEAMKDCVIEFVKQLNKNSSDIISSFIEIADRMDKLIDFMTNAFYFLDFYYTRRKKKKLTNLYDIALDMYKNILFMPFQKQITKEVNELIKEDRGGNKENRIKIKRILGIMKTLDLLKPKKEEDNKEEEINKMKVELESETPVQDYWFNLFKEDTEKFFSVKAEKGIINKSTPEYVVEQLNYLDEENERQKKLINEIYYKRLNDTIYKEIIGKNMKNLVNMDSGVKHMLENNKYNDLHNLYKLFKLYLPSLDEICEVFKVYIIKRGNNLLENKEISMKTQTFVPELINLQKEIKDLISKCFEGDQKFHKAKNDAFAEFMKLKSKSKFYSRQIAYYVDFCMRNEFKGKEQEVVEATLEEIIQLFKNLSEKYLFQSEAQKKMSDRLLKNKYLSIEIEKQFVQKLKQENGSDFVQKMVTMLEDVETSKKEMEKYKESSSSRGYPSGIKFDVLVISNNSWEVDMKRLTNFKLPNIFSSCVKDFSNFYLNKYIDREFYHWFHIFSLVEIQYLYLRNRNISKSTLPQVLILLTLEQKGALSIKKLAEYTGSKIELIKQSIQGLMFNPSFNSQSDINKGVIIPINVKSKDFKDTDEFKINTDFECQKIKFNTIPMPKKKTKEEIENEEKMSEEVYHRYKDNIIQSTATRIMKGRVKYTHALLVSEIVKQIFLFTPQPSEIKKNIEKLIEKCVLKRNEKERDCYEYIA